MSSFTDQRRDEALQVWRPRHAAAVRAIAQAVQTLADRLEDERAVRSAAQDQAGARLPELIDAGIELGCLAQVGTPLSRWARRMRVVGLLD